MSLPYGPVPVFRPTLEQFSDFSQFIRSITPQCAPYGLAKVIPPEGWTPRKSGGYEELLAGIKIPSPIKQVVQGKQGCFQLLNIEQNEMTVKDFAEAARERAERHLTDGLGHEEIERKFWRNIQFSPPMYGADMVGSLTDTDLKMWNMRELGTILDLIGISLSGINVPYLYFGMWQAMFSWHTEDMDLYSINYLHFGKPKRWYAIPSEEGKKFERVAAGYFPGMQNECKAFLRHKTTMISPLLLTRYHQITVNTCVQEAGEFMITFPYAYHAGFNHGFNCAESVNFATPEWIDFGSKASRCSCGGGTCEIDMNIFKARYVLARELAPHVTVTDEMVWRKIAQFKDREENLNRIIERLSKLVVTVVVPFVLSCYVGEAHRAPVPDPVFDFSKKRKTEDLENESRKRNKNDQVITRIQGQDKTIPGEVLDNLKGNTKTKTDQSIFSCTLLGPSKLLLSIKKPINV